MEKQPKNLAMIVPTRRREVTSIARRGVGGGGLSAYMTDKFPEKQSSTGLAVPSISSSNHKSTVAAQRRKQATVSLAKKAPPLIPAARRDRVSQPEPSSVEQPPPSLGASSPSKSNPPFRRLRTPASPVKLIPPISKSGDAHEPASFRPPATTFSESPLSSDLKETNHRTASLRNPYSAGTCASPPRPPLLASVAAQSANNLNISDKSKSSSSSPSSSAYSYVANEGKLQASSPTTAPGPASSERLSPRLRVSNNAAAESNAESATIYINGRARSGGPSLGSVNSVHNSPGSSEAKLDPSTPSRRMFELKASNAKSTHNEIHSDAELKATAVTASEDLKSRIDRSLQQRNTTTALPNLPRAHADGKSASASIMGASAHSSAQSGVDQEYLDALPPEIRAEVLASMPIHLQLLNRNHNHDRSSSSSSSGSNGIALARAGQSLLNQALLGRTPPGMIASRTPAAILRPPNSQEGGAVTSDEDSDNWMGMHQLRARARESEAERERKFTLEMKDVEVSRRLEEASLEEATIALRRQREPYLLHLYRTREQLLTLLQLFEHVQEHNSELGLMMLPAFYDTLQRTAAVARELGVHVTLIRMDEEKKSSLSRAQLDSVPHAMATKEKEDPCCICLERMAINQEVSSLTCKHDFHTACLRTWLERVNNCPLCKKEVVKVNDLQNIF